MEPFNLLGYDLRLPAGAIDWDQIGVSKILPTASCCLSVDYNIWWRTSDREVQHRGGSHLLSHDEAIDFGQQVASSQAVLLLISVRLDDNFDQVVKTIGNFPAFSDTESTNCLHPSSILRIGYDVAEGGLISALCNYQFTKEPLNSLRSRFGTQLNQRHLFDSMEDACDYRTHLADAMVLDTPLCVYELAVWAPSLDAAREWH